MFAAVTSTVASVALALFHRRRQKRLLLCGLTKEAIVGMRRRLFCAAQSVSYANTEPLLAVRGRGDSAGQTVQAAQDSRHEQGGQHERHGTGADSGAP